MGEGYEWFDRKRTMEILDESLRVPQKKAESNEDVDSRKPLPDLSGATQAWYEQLPQKIRPQVLRCEFPHLLDRFRDNWDSPRQLEKFFNELTTDERGGRAGFPFSVIRELHRLRDYYFEVLNPDAKVALQPRQGIRDNL